MKAPILIAAALVAPGLLRAQTVAQRVARAPDGVVRMTYAARPGVCGNGSNINTSTREDRDAQWETDCEHGPVRLVFTKSGDSVSHVQVRVGSRWRADAPPATDLGTVPAAEAATFLLDVARRGTKSGDEAILAAQLADSIEIWPRLLDIAKNKEIPAATRRRALFWLGQAAGDQVAEAMGNIANDAREDRDVRLAAVFGLRRRPADDAIPALIRSSDSDRDPEVRRQAMFWLSQSKDPRAVAWFEKVLTGR
jgi:hypothetical protein